MVAILLLQVIYTPAISLCQLSFLHTIQRGSERCQFPAKFALPAADVDGGT